MGDRNHWIIFKLIIKYLKWITNNVQFLSFEMVFCLCLIKLPPKHDNLETNYCFLTQYISYKLLLKYSINWLNETKTILFFWGWSNWSTLHNRNNCLKNLDDVPRRASSSVACLHKTELNISHSIQINLFLDCFNASFVLLAHSYWHRGALRIRCFSYCCSPAG